jgi:hypothetical protein
MNRPAPMMLAVALAFAGTVVQGAAYAAADLAAAVVVDRAELLVPLYLAEGSGYDRVTVVSGAALAEGEVISQPIVWCEADACDILAVETAEDVDEDGHADLLATVTHTSPGDGLATVVFGPFQDGNVPSTTTGAPSAEHARLLVSPDVTDGAAALILGGR